jgi:hypothetical protein
MAELSIHIGSWWLGIRNRIDDWFMPFITTVAVISGGILLFSGIHVLRNTMFVHIMEFIFTYSFNAALIFGLTRKAVAENISCVLTLPVLISTLVYAIFVVGLRVIPSTDPLTPWFVVLEYTTIFQTWMGADWLIISMVVGLALYFLSFWAVSRARIGDIVWPFLTYFLVATIFDSVMVFFLYLANYSTKIIGR